jgi:hypothetical protein
MLEDFELERTIVAPVSVGDIVSSYVDGLLTGVRDGLTIGVKVVKAGVGATVVEE